MTETVLVTGGAGFIGSHLVDSLVEQGHRVRVFDNLEPQVHGALRESGSWPEYSNQGAEYVLGDVRDRDALEKAMSGIDVVFHEAAMVGVGQSMYQIERYIDVNARGTAVLLDIMANESSIRDRIRKLVVASSMSIYGEGKYECTEHGEVYPKLRSEEQLARRDWEMHCPQCDRHVKPLPTDEEKPLFPTSTYAISKEDQEEMCLVVGRAYNIPVVALRYFNTYGPRQSLSNPYTGVAAIFASRLLNNNSPVIFEDGQQSRDFVHVSDIVQANLLAMTRPQMDFGTFNVGTGDQIAIVDVALGLSEHLGKSTQVDIVRKYRAGDIRHCFAEIDDLSRHGYKRRVSFNEGLSQLTEWVRITIAVDNFNFASDELSGRGLTG
ncbi:MAG: SDR family NAD(P)-dependent oxidoreductase [Candidatus Promineifilaceae bacterium]